MKLNVAKVEERENDLIHFNGFIPLNLFMHINMLERNTYLKNIGKYNEVEADNIRVRNSMNKADDTDLFEEQVLKNWIRNNPQFEDLVIFD